MQRGGTLESKWSADCFPTQTTADGTIRFKMNDFNVLGKKLRDITLNLNAQAVSDATNILTNILRITIAFGSEPGWDALLTHFRALIGFITKKAALATAVDYLNIPLHMYRGYSAPPGKNLDLKISKNATYGTNQVPKVSMNLGFNQLHETRGYLNILSKLYGVPASSNGTNIKPDQPGNLQYVILPTLTGVTGFRYADDRGVRAFFTDVKTLIAQQEQYSGVAYAAPYSGPFVIKIPEEREVKSGVTEISLLTNSSWVDDEITLVTEYPNPKLAAAGK